MPCYHPLQGWRAKDLGPSGKRAVVFSPDKGFVDLPVTVPCGQCIGCRLERARQWQARLVHEAQFHVYRWFVTLTYSDENLPPGGTLVKADFQKFMKRLRKNSGLRLRYFHCGEYGDTTKRAHYHAIIFGLPIPDLRPYSKNHRGDVIYTSETLEKVWGLGNCMIGSFSKESAGYVARYILKKVTGEASSAEYRVVDEKTGEVFDRLAPYVTMSKKPGIGDTWFDKFADSDLAHDYCVVDGHEMPVPKRYDRRIEALDPEELAKRKLARRKKAARNKANNTPERLAVREEVKLAQIKSLTRSYEK